MQASKTHRGGMSPVGTVHQHGGKGMSVSELVFISVGGIVGAGFFLGCGLPMRMAGPSVLAAYLVGAFITSQVTGALTSMAMDKPSKGSFKVFADWYVGPFVGYLQGWTYYLTSILTIASEAVAMAIFTKLWLPHVATWIFAVVYAVIILGLNAFGVKNFGRIESLMSVVKIAALVGFIIFAAILLGTGRTAVPFTQAFSPFAPHGWTGAMQSMLIVIFAFAGIGVFGTAAASVRKPSDIDKGALLSIAGLTVLYLASIAGVFISMSWSSVSSTRSPFVDALAKFHTPLFATVFNGVILIASFSVMAGAVFSSTQILYSLGKRGEAPRFVLRKNHKGVELGALLVTAVAILLTIVLAQILPANVYQFLISASSFLTFFNWVFILWTFLRWRREQHGDSSRYSMLSIGKPVTTWLTMVVIIVLAGYALTQRDQRFGFYAFAGLTIAIAVSYWFARKAGGARAVDPLDSE